SAANCVAVRREKGGDTLISRCYRPAGDATDPACRQVRSDGEKPQPDTVKQQSLFKLLSGGVEILVRNANPWWRGEELSGVPPFRRWAFEPVIESLRQGLSPATVLRGPRQIGKTTLLNQIIQKLLAEGVAPNRIVRLQFDDPRMVCVPLSTLMLMR
ncbi:MAG: AAA family ATPase, partial [Verrucomicrobia bacterium]|nr:AAA family ATPase [Verrucomicrobiota bacterium]